MFCPVERLCVHKGSIFTVCCGELELTAEYWVLFCESLFDLLWFFQPEVDVKEELPSVHFVNSLLLSCIIFFPFCKNSLLSTSRVTFLHCSTAPFVFLRSLRKNPATMLLNVFCLFCGVSTCRWCNQLCLLAIIFHSVLSPCINILHINFSLFNARITDSHCCFLVAEISLNL